MISVMVSIIEGAISDDDIGRCVRFGDLVALLMVRADHDDGELPCGLP